MLLDLYIWETILIEFLTKMNAKRRHCLCCLVLSYCDRRIWITVDENAWQITNLNDNVMMSEFVTSWSQVDDSWWKVGMKRVQHDDSCRTGYDTFGKERFQPLISCLVRSNHMNVRNTFLICSNVATRSNDSVRQLEILQEFYDYGFILAACSTRTDWRLFSFINIL